MFTRLRLPTALLGVIAVGAAGAVVALSAPAQAATVGDATFIPATGNANQIQDITSDGPCNAPAVRVRAKAYGFGFPANGQIIYGQSINGFSTTEAMRLPVAQTWKGFAQDNGNTYLTGSYDVRIECVNTLGSVVYDDYRTTITWSTPGNDFANIDSATYTSGDVVVPPGPTTFTTVAAPRVAGVAKVGGTLTANRGTWTPAPTAYAYQWLRNGAPIAGARATTYKPVAADVGRNVSVRVTATKAGVTTKAAASNALAVKAGTFAKGKKPTVKGKAKVGKKLTANAGTWSPLIGSAKYQWLRNGKVIKGAKGAKVKYKVIKKDRKKKISVRVTVTAPGYTNYTAVSAKKKVKGK